MTDEKVWRLVFMDVSGDLDGGFAYFSDDPDAEWGDDWDDSPFQHNAGRPYGRTDLRIVPFMSDWLRHDWMVDASVKDMQDGRVPWLASGDGTIEVRGRVTLDGFLEALDLSDSLSWRPRLVHKRDR